MAGDTNLYRYVGNDPTRQTDPHGLGYFILGAFAGPASAAQPGSSKPPTVVYSQLRGETVGLASLWAGSGTWGQPASNATGAGTLLRNGNKDLNGNEISDANFGGARTSVSAWGAGASNGACNTVYAFGDGGYASGTLGVSFNRFKPGTYHVSLRINSARFRAAVRVSVAGAGGLGVMDWLGSGTGKKSLSASIGADVTVGPSGKAWVAKIEPSVGVPAGATWTGWARAEVVVEDIE